MDARTPRNELPVWDLSDLYASPNDPKIAADLATAAAEVATLKRYEGAFEAARGDAAKLGGLIAEGVALYETIADRLGAVGAYAALKAQTALTRREGKKTLTRNLFHRKTTA